MTLSRDRLKISETKGKGRGEVKETKQEMNKTRAKFAKIVVETSVGDDLPT